MKLPDSYTVLVPWFDTEGNKHWMKLNFKGGVDHRRVRREIRKLIKKTFGRSVTNEWIAKSCLHERASIDAHLPTVNIDDFIEGFIQRMRHEENEDGAHSDSEGTPAREAEVPLCSLPNQT